MEYKRWWLPACLILILVATSSAVETAYKHSPDWTYRVGGKVNSIKYADNLVLVGSDDSLLYAISRDGDLVWKYPVDNPVTSVDVADDNITVTSMDGLIYRLDPKGNTLWVRELPGYVGYDGGISSGRGIISAGTMNGKVYVLDNDGNQLSSYDAGGYVIATRVLDDGILAITDRHVLVIADNGSLTTSSEFSSYVRAAKTTGKYSAVGLSDGRIYLYDNSGVNLWSYDTKDQIGTLYASDNYVAAGTKNKKLLVFSVNGTLMWERLMTDSVIATFIEEPFIAVSTLDNTVQLYYTDGTLKWIYATDGRTLDLDMDGRYLLSGTANGGVYFSELPKKSSSEVFLVAGIVVIVLLLGLLVSIGAVRRV